MTPKTKTIWRVDRDGNATYFGKKKGAVEYRALLRKLGVLSTGPHKVKVPLGQDDLAEWVNSVIKLQG